MMNIGIIADRMLYELAYSAHKTRLISEKLRVSDQISGIGFISRSRLGLASEPPENKKYTTTREYAHRLAIWLLSQIPEKYSAEALKRAEEELKYYGMPKVNGKHPKLA